MAKYLVFFHANCFDGTLAAAVYIHYLRHLEAALSDYKFIAWDYKEEITDFAQFEGCNVTLLDLTFREEAFEEVARLAAKVTVIDHHPRAHRQVEQYKVNPTPKLRELMRNVTFITDSEDNKQAGAPLTFRYLFPRRILPDVVRWIGKGDLFNFDEPEIRHMRFAAGTLGFDPIQWEDTLLHRSENVHRLVKEGAVLAKAADAQIEYFVKNCLTRIMIDGHSVIACNAPRFIASELAARIYNATPVEESPFVVIFYEEGGKTVYSLRCIKGGPVNVGELAMKFGGDGHETAAGFSVTVHKCPLTPRLLPEPKPENRAKQLISRIRYNLGWAKDPSLM